MNFLKTLKITFIGLINKGRTISFNIDFFILTIILLGINVPYFRSVIVPVHDTMTRFQIFHYLTKRFPTLLTTENYFTSSTRPTRWSEPPNIPIFHSICQEHIGAAAQLPRHFTNSPHGQPITLLLIYLLCRK